MLTAHPETDRPPVDLFGGSLGLNIEEAERAAVTLLAAVGVTEGREVTIDTPQRR